jgi:hypothetical protein
MATITMHDSHECALPPSACTVRVQDDPKLEGYNLPERTEAVIAAAQEYAKATRGSDVMLMMGTDFTYSNAFTWYKNVDKLIRGINASGRATAVYSTPTSYLATKAQLPGKWPLITDDFFPYADSPHTYWTGACTPCIPAMRAV